jgi:hypothetical protein
VPFYCGFVHSPMAYQQTLGKQILHVRLDDSDGNLNRFIWLSDPTIPESKFDIFRFNTVLFGLTSSTFMLNATLRSHLENYDLLVAQEMKDNIYVDNIISGCDQETDSILCYNDARSIMHNAHFNLHSWALNCYKIWNSWSQNHCQHPRFGMESIKRCSQFPTSTGLHTTFNYH